MSAKYYQVNIERLQKKARERYQNLSKEGKEKKRQYGRERYKNPSEDEKQSLLNKVKRSLYILLEKDDKISNKYCIFRLIKSEYTVFIGNFVIFFQQNV